MKLVCKFCKTEYDETLTNCPNCGAPNKNVKKTAESGPRTLDELKTWFYDTHKLTSEKTHIYVGINHKEPACFGMYKDENTGDFVVYKNKANGERAVRYQGVDEQYAVNELYQLIQRQALRNGVDLNGAKNPGQITNRNSAINNSKNYNNLGSYNRSNKVSSGCLTQILFYLVIFFVAFNPIGIIKKAAAEKKAYNAVVQAYKDYKNYKITENEYYKIVEDNDYIEYLDGKFVKNNSSMPNDLKYNLDTSKNVYGYDGSNSKKFNTLYELQTWMNSFPYNQTTNYYSSDDYYYKSTTFTVQDIKGDYKSFYIVPHTEEYHHYVSHNSYDNDSGGSSSSGSSSSSWDDDDDWDSGDWDSDWGYNFKDSIYWHLC